MQPRTFSLSNRRLGHGHFAFMRGVVQGLDLRSSWDRYLSVEGEATDLRRVKSTIAWIRSEFAAAARRHSKPGTARLVVMDASSLPDAPAQPSLADFAAERGLEDFSEAEQLERAPGPRNTSPVADHLAGAVRLPGDPELLDRDPFAAVALPWNEGRALGSRRR